jgi:glutamate/tyrosine decarboxylase-like PLP-dependent enzyme
VQVWAALRSLGRESAVDQVSGLVRQAAALAAQLSAVNGVEVLNDVDYTRVSLAFGDVRG